jgi:glycine oxidase
MISPQTEASGPGPFFDLCLRSRSLYPEFTAEVTELSGIDVEYRDQGSFCIQLTEDDRSHARQWTTWQNEAGLRIESIPLDTLHQLEPAVTESATGAVFVPSDHQVENRRLMQGLELALRRLGVEVIEEQTATELTVERNRVTGILCGAQRLDPGLVVIAAGCWSGELLEPAGLNVGTIPARGQMVALKGAGSPINHVLHSSKCYVIPRLDGRILVGATVEYVGFQKGITAGGISSLLAAAIELAPGLTSCEIVEAWSGLRPDTSDHLPILGPSGVDNLLLATGHFRNGILLAPITAELIAATISGGGPILELIPFSIARFHRTF